MCIGYEQIFPFLHMRDEKHPSPHVKGIWKQVEPNMDSLASSDIRRALDLLW